MVSGLCQCCKVHGSTAYVWYQAYASAVRCMALQHTCGIRLMPKVVDCEINLKKRMNVDGNV